MRYFFVTIRNTPKNKYDSYFNRVESNKYCLVEDGSLWEYRKMVDLGRGSESGYCRLPIPNYDELLSFVLNFDKQKMHRYVSDEEQNFYGSLSVLLYDYPMRFFNDLGKLLDTERFDCELNMQMIEIINREFLVDDNILHRLSNKNQQVLCEKWRHLYNLINSIH